MEQLLVAQREREMVAQRDHEVTMYRDTNRLITIFGVTFAAIGVIALLAAAYLNFRGLAALQALAPKRPPLEPQEPAPSRGLLETGGRVPGMERVQASGQRFQSRMSSLEHRLAELEHIAGRDSEPGSESAPDATMIVPETGHAAPAAALPVEAEFIEPPRRVIPRAALMVHKAQALMNLGKLDDALATLDEAVAIERTRGEVHLARGQVLEKLGRLGDALLAYETAVESDATNTGALLMKAGVLNRQERFSEALACYERALEVSRANG
jgi:tetratricopeptide (TPR) repeat protein